jgi:hypothetical protein
MSPDSAIVMQKRSAGECRSNGIDYFAPRGEHTQSREGAGINHSFPVDQHFELTISAPHHLNFLAQFSTKPGRHTGGVETGHSIRAVANDNASHFHLPQVTGLDSTSLVETSMRVTLFYDGRRLPSRPIVRLSAQLTLE